MIPLTNYDFQWARSELVIIYPDNCDTLSHHLWEIPWRKLADFLNREITPWHLPAAFPSPIWILGDVMGCSMISLGTSWNHWKPKNHPKTIQKISKTTIWTTGWFGWFPNGSTSKKYEATQTATTDHLCQQSEKIHLSGTIEMEWMENILWWTNILPWKDPPFLMGKSTISIYGHVQ